MTRLATQIIGFGTSVAGLLLWGCAGADEGGGPEGYSGTGGAGVSGAMSLAAGGAGPLGAGGAVQQGGGPPLGAGGQAPVGAGGMLPNNGGAASSSGGVGAGGAAPGSGGAAPGAGGTAGAGGVGGESGTGGAGADDRPPCMTNPSQVISMGDSYMNWGTHTFPSDLNAVAGVTFRPTYAVGGTSMGSGGIGLIPPQFDVAVGQDPDIIAVVLDGGGNDLLIPALGRPDCKNLADADTNPGCQQIVTDGITASTALMTKMADAGVHDVIYFFYPHVPAPTALGGSYPNVMLDYALPLVREACESAKDRSGGKLTCWFVDLIPVFEGHNEWFAAGDIHENSQGSRAMAEAIVQVMKDQCIAQPASSGCCAP